MPQSPNHTLLRCSPTKYEFKWNIHRKAAQMQQMLCWTYFRKTSGLNFCCAKIEVSQKSGMHGFPWSISTYKQVSYLDEESIILNTHMKSLNRPTGNHFFMWIMKAACKSWVYHCAALGSHRRDSILHLVDSNLRCLPCDRFLRPKHLREFCPFPCVPAAR